jgi:hypothetical protein
MGSAAAWLGSRFALVAVVTVPALLCWMALHSGGDEWWSHWGLVVPLSLPVGAVFVTVRQSACRTLHALLSFTVWLLPRAGGRLAPSLLRETLRLARVRFQPQFCSP